MSEATQDDRPKVRTNGFERPFHPLQVLSWVVFGSDVILYIVFGLPLIETIGAKVGVALCYVISVIVLVVATAKATSCDPADPHVRLQDESELKGEEPDSMPYCTMCNVPVFSRSKHCRACNKCVTVFDHHCMWLNNCVGGANYQSFFVTISSVAVMIGIILGTSIYLLCDYLLDEEVFEQRYQEIPIFESLPKEFFLGLFILMVLVNAPLFLLDMQLVILHTFLSSQHLTTYEYIMNKRNQMEAQEEEKSSNDKAGSRLGRKIRTLPHWMDWIVFSRCGQRRKQKPNNDNVEKIETVEDKVDTEAAGADPASKGANRLVASSQAPPGSTAAEEDLLEQERRASQQAGGPVPVAEPQVAQASDMRVVQDESGHKASEPGDSTSSPPLVASKIGCGCDTTSKTCEKPPAPAKL